jgi:ankyrin repeat protein
VDTNGNTPLHLAVSHEDYVMTLVLLRKGADPNIANKSGVLPIQIAQRMRMSTIIALLPKFGSIVQPEEKVIPLSESSPVSLVDQVKIGLFGNEGVEIKQREQFRYGMETTIVSASAAGYLGFSETIPKIETFADTRDEKGCTVLMKACFRGHFNLVNALVSSKNLDRVDNYGNTALIWAIIAGRIDIAKLLVEQGASVNGTPFLKDGQIRPKVYNTPLAATAYLGNAEMTEYLLEKGAQPDEYIGLKKRTAIKIAAWLRQKSVVLTLIRHGAFVDQLVDAWMTTGIIALKKLSIENNPWIRLAPDGMYLVTNRQI